MKHEVINPATEQVVTTVELFDEAATDEAIARSRRAFSSWRAVAPGDRARLLRRFAAAVDADIEHLARWRWRTPGTPSATRGGRRATSETCSTTTPARPERLIGRRFRSRVGIDVTFHEPLGVVGAIVPWNFPMPIASWAFATGAGRGQHRGAQAGGADPAHRAAAAANWRSTPACPRTCSRCCRARAAWWGSDSSTTRTLPRSSSPVPPRSAGRSWPAALGGSSRSPSNSAARART